VVGIYDSGSGGEEALAFFEKMRPDAAVTFLADRKNAPYGEKSEGELIPIIEAATERLISSGCERVLIACCTASALYGRLSERVRGCTIPIIEPTAKEAVRVSETKRIAVISTEATKRSGAFVKAILGFCPSAEVISLACPKLVRLADSGFCDANLSGASLSCVKAELRPLTHERFDTVVLGCTHFSRFEKTVEDMLLARTVNSALIGAEILSKETMPSKNIGGTIYLEP
jgi:glutamate racemase